MDSTIWDLLNNTEETTFRIIIRTLDLTNLRGGMVKVVIHRCKVDPLPNLVEGIILLGCSLLSLSKQVLSSQQ